MPDISSELDTIKNNVYGDSVKQAIYDALVKVNNAKSQTPSRVYSSGLATLLSYGNPKCIIGNASNGGIE